MAKKVILYPLVKESTYAPQSEWNDEHGITGTPREVKGSLIDYGAGGDNVEWVENRVFPDTLTYTGYGRGRSSAVFYFEGSLGEKYQMFMTDMDDLLKYAGVLNKEVTAWWTYQKRGQNYGIRLADSEKGGKLK
ncbi:hypothetical protein BH780_gp118 [Bacillus phage Eldridge]|uniref:Uncharacterized protein n=1 Tax=Bacillus phage Eldridge TaxID=1776293 RepID=A0A120HUN5_9CAUD|nr:hypothetical protein BH780_gp118 [Bacillus phage Eldridge]AMB18701.1 hypothetical protein Eldridge_0121 [Bacillus phage Eldridge]